MQSEAVTESPAGAPRDDAGQDPGDPMTPLADLAGVTARVDSDKFALESAMALAAALDTVIARLDVIDARLTALDETVRESADRLEIGLRWVVQTVDRIRRGGLSSVLRGVDRGARSPGT